MVETMFLAQIVGVYLLLASLSALLHPDRMKHAIQEFSKSSVIPYLDASMALIVGLIIVMVHNDWSGLPASIVSLVGWVAILEGALLFLLPEETIRGVSKWFRDPMVGKAVSATGVLAGGYLVYAGFFM